MKANLKEINAAKQLLKKEGYYISDLWHVLDVNYINENQYFNCTNEKAYSILNTVLSSEHIIEIIRNKIRFEVHQE
tara:strand:+ start:248 stop:475 length:228 start_codon:yes stop_codon:yes gene_type:complete